MSDAPRAPGVLVIKHGALGDFVLAFGPFQAIRRHHPHAPITLLTTRPFVALAEASPWFDAVWADPKPRWHEAGAWLALRRRLRGGGFGRVYDLQTSARSSLYFELFRPGRRPDWSGIARGASLPDTQADRATSHTLERQRGQLARAGIAAVPPPDLSWLETAGDPFGIGDRAALLVPGSAPHRPEKRWPAASFAALAARLAASGYRPVLLGTAAEGAVTGAIAREVPACRDLKGATSLADLGSLGRRAALAVGNDTGPLHLLAAAGTPSLALFGPASDPARARPRGPAVRVMAAPDLGALAVDAVAAAALALGGAGRPRDGAPWV